MTRILFATSEALPLVKTGGLADVAGALPTALAALDLDLRVVMPAYRGCLDKLHAPRRLGELLVRGQRFAIHEGRVGGEGSPLFWLVNYPSLYAREGDPYHDAAHRPWPDNTWRYGCFSEAVARLALGEATQDWTADVVHGNDWQTGLAMAWLAETPKRPRTVFTIHNLAYAGTASRAEFDALGLPPRWWNIDGVEFHGQMSCLKAGLQFADAITTVSPGYAREIQTPEFGHGLDGLLRHLSGKLSGIVNGIDTGAWNPARDAALVQHYTAKNLVSGKRANRAALQAELGLAHDDDAVLIGMVGRMTAQKGYDLVLAALPEILETLPVQLAMLASGDRAMEAGFAATAATRTDRIGLKLGYDEGLAHRIEAGSDLFLMPSRFEPCGLNQMYSQRYGTPPIVRRVGGLADTVVDATEATLADSTATGIVFDHADAPSLLHGLRRAVALAQDRRALRGLQRAGMRRDFSWRLSAERYRALYLA
jgi:starch synthase